MIVGPPPAHLKGIPQRRTTGRRPWVLVLALGLLAILLGLGWAAPARAATRVVKLRSGSPAAIADILRQTFGRQVRVADAPMISALVLNSDRDDLLDQAAALIAELDHPPVTFRFALRRISAEEARTWQGGVTQGDRGTRLQAQQGSRHDRSAEVRTVVGLEGFPVALTDETTRVVDHSTPWGPQTAVLKSERGLRILGRRAGEGAAVVEVRYAEGPETNATRLVSQVGVRLGEWTYLGEIAGDRAGGGNEAQVRGSQGGVSVNRTSGSQSAHYLVRVDIVGP